MAAKATKDPNLFKPLDLNGPAVERDKQVKDHNDAVRPSEAEWLKQAATQDADISAFEVEFFATLRSRMKTEK